MWRYFAVNFQNTQYALIKTRCIIYISETKSVANIRTLEVVSLPAIFDHSKMVLLTTYYYILNLQVKNMKSKPPFLGGQKLQVSLPPKIRPSLNNYPLFKNMGIKHSPWTQYVLYPQVGLNCHSNGITSERPENESGQIFLFLFTNPSIAA